MRKSLILILGLLSLMPASAQTMDLRNKILLKRNKIESMGLIKHENTHYNPGHIKTRTIEDSTDSHSSTSYISAFVRMANGYEASDLEAIGMNVHSIKGRIAIVSFPMDSVESFSNKECVEKLSIEKKLNPQMNTGRQATGIDEIHEGANLKLPYTGKNVLGIVVDQGIDPNNISFIDKEGKNRVKYLTYLDGSYENSGYPKVQYYGEDIIYEDEKGNILKYPSIDKFYTDTYSAYHGTHTLNIFGGNYRGNVTLNENGQTKEVPSPYYGVATEADLAVSCGDLSDTSVAWGLAEMLGYAEYRKEDEGIPAVVSISLGSTAGPHDPGSLMNEYLAMCGDEAIIVISAGNEGDLKIALNKTFTNDDTTLQSMVYPFGYQYDPDFGAPSTSNTYLRNGVVMIYSDDATPFTVKGFIMTGTYGNYRKRATLDISSPEGIYYASDSWADYVGGVKNATLDKYFEGYLGGGAMLDEDLGRYYGAFDYYLVTNPETGINEDGSEGVIVGFEITGVDGQRIDCYCDGANTWIYNYGMENYQDGSRDGTISDMAVGHNVLVVGAYNTRETWITLDGKDYSYDVEGIEIGDIGPYSSYGTLSDGRTLPHVCAPGTAIMSAISTPWVDYYFAGHEDYIQYNTTAMATVGNEKYYWKPETGTSMSTPLVAGSIALWLEANPNLTINDIYDIIEKTSVKDEYVLRGNPVQWGAGKFDALAGLKEVISRAGAGVDQISIDKNDRLILTKISPGVFNVFAGSVNNFKIEVFSVSGNKVYSNQYSGNEVNLDLTSLSPGVYIIKVNNHSTKIML